MLGGVRHYKELREPPSTVDGRPIPYSVGMAMDIFFSLTSSGRTIGEPNMLEVQPGWLRFEARVQGRKEGHAI